ncbi:antiviral reverse transcriptase Drt4 [Martelella limonii]|uniref:antiviral reverse transcriptase Drt4 n=1 Tax=Martelella limonii TaxID=1647649 RepID=UPI001580B947|nr:antiviral reverse transcriptase Drt4 [Martelella limonii]
MKSEDQEPLELTAENIRKSLLQFNYFPFTHEKREELPPIFGSEMLTPEVGAKLNEFGLSKFRRESGFDAVHFKRTRHPGIPRSLSIPHPKAHVDLVEEIVKNWDGKISKRCQSPNSILNFEIQSDYRIIVHSYGSIYINNDAESTDPSVDFGSMYRVKTDITNFFKSIYTHSLSWALVGAEESKRNRGSDRWYNNLDRAARISQRNETKGISIGPATSSILSELVLFPIDEHLRNKGYNFYRYIDDYTCFAKDRDQADSFLFELSRKLEDYSLHLNARKTDVREMPVPTSQRWVVEMNQVLALADRHKDVKKDGLSYKDVRLIIEKAIILSDENPDGSVAKYAFSSILEMGFSELDAEKYVEDSLLRYSFYYPSLVPLIYRWIERYSVKIEAKDRILSILDRSFKSGHSDNVTWCIFLLIRTDPAFRKDIIEKSLAENSPLVILMSYVYTKTHGADTRAFKEWANRLKEKLTARQIVEYDLDQYWVVLYQMFLDGEIDNPYAAQEDIKVFNCLKKEKVSFVDYGHKGLDLIFKDIRF